MGPLFIVSSEEGAGKTALGAGLAVILTGQGRKVAYAKWDPAGKTVADGDTSFMQQIPGVAIAEETGTGGYDVVIMEGRLGRSPADEASQTAYAAAKTMKAKIIAVEAFSVGGSPFIDAYKGFGGDLLGVVINKVPRSQFRHVRAQVESFFKAAGIKLLGIIPENRMLLAVTVGELAENLGGKILNSEAKADELVENYMLGAMVVGSGLDYFGRKERKAAIIRRDRPDMQLAALETSTVCLVLSGGEGPPAPGVLYKAESRGIPVISAGAPTGDIVAVVEETLRKTRVHQTGKLARLAETVGQNIDIKALT